MTTGKTIGRAAGLVLLAAAACGGPAAAQDKPVQLKLSHWVPPAHPLQPAIQAWADAIKATSGGSITAAIFPAEQLGKAFDHYDMARDGIADFTYVNPGYQPGRFPVIAAGELPFLIGNGRGGTQALDAWYRKYAAREMKDVHFCMAFVHYPGSFHSRTKIVLPTDMRGLKIRPANASIGSLVTLLGGNNVQASAPQSRDLLERGVADAIAFPWGSVVLFGIDKVVRYHIEAPLYVSTFVWVMNQARYDGMSAAQRKVVDDHCTTEWAEKLAGPWSDFEEGGIAKIKAEAGHEVYKLTAEQLEAWRQAAEPLRQAWADGAKGAGVDPEAALGDLKSALATYNAAY
jgi:TRAP-type C4-dicarboxylate transport system substrate-binding protein